MVSVVQHSVWACDGVFPSIVTVLGLHTSEPEEQTSGSAVEVEPSTSPQVAAAGYVVTVVVQHVSWACVGLLLPMGVEAPAEFVLPPKQVNASVPDTARPLTSPQVASDR